MHCRVRGALLAAAAVVVAACACPPKGGARPALFAVVPGVNGHVGAVVVRTGRSAQVIDSGYGAQRLLSDGTLQPLRLSEAELRDTFGTALDALPGRPTSFTLYFLEGSDELTDQSKVELDKVFGDLRTRPLPDIFVIGHTDTVGSADYNDKLSLARAERLREMLVAMGLPADRIQAAGRGKRELLVPTEDNVSEPRNRRVEINVR